MREAYHGLIIGGGGNSYLSEGIWLELHREQWPQLPLWQRNIFAVIHPECEAGSQIWARSLCPATYKQVGFGLGLSNACILVRVVVRDLGLGNLVLGLGLAVSRPPLRSPLSLSNPFAL